MFVFIRKLEKDNVCEVLLPAGTCIRPSELQEHAGDAVIDGFKIRYYY